MSPEHGPKAVILNDTRVDPHFGCHRVMRVIEQNLSDRGISVTARSGAGNAWAKDRRFLAALSDADLVVINGEGTLHHGAAHGQTLLEIAEHPARGRKPIALINAMYQENPRQWARYLDRIDLISVRDRLSEQEIRNATGRPDIRCMMDLSVCEGFHPMADSASRTMLTVGESVLKNATSELASLLRENGEARFLPIVTEFKSRKLSWPKPCRWVRDIHVRMNTRSVRRQFRTGIFPSTEREYENALLGSQLHVTGRFHAVCFAVATKTPFLALASNAWKIEALLSDLGLDRGRVLTFDALRDRVACGETCAFDADERMNMEKAIARTVEEKQKLFDAIAALAYRSVH